MKSEFSGKLQFDSDPYLSRDCCFFYIWYYKIGRGYSLNSMNWGFFLAHLNMKFQKNIPLKNYTTFKIGGRATYFFIAKTKLQLIEAIKKAKQLSLPLFVLGGGSNLLVSDKRYNGLVVKTQNTKCKIQNTKVYAEAGLALSRLVKLTLKSSLTGFEWAAGIPGTIGGAIFGNAGAFSKSTGDVVSSVEVFDLRKNCIRKLKNKDCRFGYRQSIFKKSPHLVILSCEMKLKVGDRQEIKEEVEKCLDYRASYHPKEPSAGSVFTNPPRYAARELIDICGLKGKRIGGAQISEVHSNFIVNLNGAGSQDVAKLIDLVKKTVDKKFKIKLKEEIIRLNS